MRIRNFTDEDIEISGKINNKTSRIFGLVGKPGKFRKNSSFKKRGSGKPFFKNLMKKTKGIIGKHGSYNKAYSNFVRQFNGKFKEWFKLTLKSTPNDIPKFRDTFKVLDSGKIERINYKRKVPFEFKTFDYTVAYKKIGKLYTNNRKVAELSTNSIISEEEFVKKYCISYNDFNFREKIETGNYIKKKNWLYYPNCFEEIVVKGKKFIFNSYNDSEYLKQKYIKLKQSKTFRNKQKKKVFKEYSFKREEIT